MPPNTASRLECLICGADMTEMPFGAMCPNCGYQDDGIGVAALDPPRTTGDRDLFGDPTPAANQAAPPRQEPTPAPIPRKKRGTNRRLLPPTDWLFPNFG